MRKEGIGDLAVLLDQDAFAQNPGGGDLDRSAIARVARRIFSAPPTFTALGPIGRVESFERITGRLAP